MAFYVGSISLAILSNLYFVSESHSPFISGASVEEKKNGMSYAHTYVSKTDRPLRSISVVNQRRAHHLYKEMAQ